MLFKRYIDLALGDNKYIDNIRIDTDIPKGDILTISPMLTNYGAKFKNITLLTDRYGNQYKVIGNYKDIIDMVRQDKNNKIGFK